MGKYGRRYSAVGRVARNAFSAALAYKGKKRFAPYVHKRVRSRLR